MSNLDIPSTFRSFINLLFLYWQLSATETNWLHQSSPPVLFLLWDRLLGLPQPNLCRSEQRYSNGFSLHWSHNNVFHKQGFLTAYLDLHNVQFLASLRQHGLASLRCGQVLSSTAFQQRGDLRLQPANKRRPTMEKSTSCKPLIYSLKNESTKNEIDSDKSFLFHLQEKCLNNGNFANKDNMNLWIVDYGASTHMNCHNRMTDITPIVPCFIHMLNGSSTVAKFEGSVVLSPSLVLTHVLYVPNLTYDLLYISQLLEQYPHYYVKVIPKGLCLIQDDIMGKEVGAGRLINRLYHFLHEQAFHTNVVSTRATTSTSITPLFV